MSKYTIAFITMYDIRSVADSGIYQDLLREFANNGHKVYVISTAERRTKIKTKLYDDIENVHVLKVKTGNLQKTNMIEKGISIVLLEKQILDAIRKYLSDVHFDLVLFSTPPITTVKPVEYLKRRDSAYAYLLLKDIFPQNAVDIGVLSNRGFKKYLYQYFRNKEKKLYDISDKIGCMSQANVNYVLLNNENISPSKVEVCPNCVDIKRGGTFDGIDTATIRQQYGLPKNKFLFIYGGNFGRPQDIPNIIRCIDKCQAIENVFFLLVGDGTEYAKLSDYFEKTKPSNAKLMKAVAKDEYDNLVSASDVGLLFLDHRFTIPNFPSRMLSYMGAKKAVLACTDENSDIGEILLRIGGGAWCLSDDENKFYEAVQSIITKDLKKMGNANYEYMVREFDATKCYSIITNALKM